ncbi:MAG: YncE family protein [Thermoplasmata archaeon]
MGGRWRLLRSPGWLAATTVVLLLLGGAATIAPFVGAGHFGFTERSPVRVRNLAQASDALSEEPRREDLLNSGTPGVVATIPVGNLSGPEPPAFDPATGNLFVPEYDTDNVSVIHGGSEQILGTVAVGVNPIAALYDPSNNLVYVVNAGSDNVSVLSGSNDSVVTSIGVGSYPDAPTLVPASGNIYVSNFDSGNVSVISATTDQVTATIAVGDEPDQPVLDATNGDLYVANDLYVSVIDPTQNTIVDTIRLPTNLGLNPPAFDTATGDLYFTEALASGVLILAGMNNSFAGNVTVAAPSGSTAVLDPLTGDLYDVTNEGTGIASNITVIATSSNTILGSIRTPGVPQAPVLDEFDGNLYVPEQNQTDLLDGVGGGNVSVISGLEVEATLLVGVDPLTPTYDSTNHDVYVANWDSTTPSTVSVISPTGTSSAEPLTIDSFTANPSVVLENQTTTLSAVASGGTGEYGYFFSGLPPGCSTENVSSLSCAPGALGYFTVNVTVSDSAGHTVQLSTGLGVVAAPAPGTYDVVFEETGLPAGRLWSVTVASSPRATSVAPLLTINEPNGSYSYAVGSVAGYSATPTSGTLRMAGSTVIQSIDFRASFGSEPSNSGWLGLPNSEGTWLVGGVVVVAIAVALAWLFRRRHGDKSGSTDSSSKASRESIYDPPPPPPSSQERRVHASGMGAALPPRLSARATPRYFRDVRR